MRHTSPTQRPIALVSVESYETALPFLIWAFGTPLIILFQVICTSYQ
jgi:hypothetical protein